MTTGGELAERDAAQRDGHPAGAPCWVDTEQLNPEAAVGFYGGLFGWEFADRMPRDSDDRYYVGRLGGRDVAGVASRFGAVRTPAWNTHVRVESADDAAATATRAGGTVVTEPFDLLTAGRMAVLADPAGATLCVWEPNEHRGAELVDEPGTWAFSTLNTPDPDGARAFYAEVFGWEAIDVGAGDDAEPTMFRLPGTERAVAWLSRTSGRRFANAVAARWDVTFAVADPDHAAERTATLGGRVVAAAFDRGPERIAVLRDPQGAMFSVSRYDP